MKKKILQKTLWFALFTSLNLPVSLLAQGTAFTYQGKLNDGGSPANGCYDVRSLIWDASTNGNVVAGPLTNSATGVTNGLFAVTLDFGSGVFTGPDRWLELDVRTNGGGTFTNLVPLQPINPVPYAIMANTASNLLGPLPAAQLSGSVSNISNIYLPLTANGAGAIYSGGNRLIQGYGSGDFFAGANAGNFTMSGGGNTAVGSQALWANTTGADNSSLGYSSLLNNTSGSENTAVGIDALANNVMGGHNVALGSMAGFNITGDNNIEIGNWGSSTDNNAIRIGDTQTQTFIAGVINGNGAGLTNLNGSSFAGNSLNLGGTNRVAPLTVPPNVPFTAIGGVGRGTGPVAVAVAGNYAYVVNYDGSMLMVFDVSTPSAPASNSFVSTLGGPVSIAVAGCYAYVANNGGGSLQIFDVSDPSAPVSVGSASTGSGSGPTSVAVAGRYAYVVNYNSSTLQVFDVSTPSKPLSVLSVTTDSHPWSIALAGSYAYVANYGSNTLQVFDVSTPSQTHSVGSGGTGDGPYSVAVSGRYAYVANYLDGTLQVFDVINPSRPVSVGSVFTGNLPHSVAVAGRYAYLVNADADTLQLFDVSTPSAPALVGTMPTHSHPNCVAVCGRYAYVVNWGGDVALEVFDLGGAYVQQLEAGALETGMLQTRDTATVGNNLDVRGGLTVSASARISGGLSVDNGTISGNGAGLTNLNAGSLSGSLSNINNIYLPAPTTGAGIIYSGANTLMIEDDSQDFFAGSGAGNLTAMTMGGNGDNTGVGSDALQNITWGDGNTAIGYNALASDTFGLENTAIGVCALYANVGGDFNTANGNAALYSNTYGEYNTANGNAALYSNTIGNQNTAYGFSALSQNTSGSGNLALGYHAGYNLTNGDNNIDIGNLGETSDSNIIRIGDAQTETHLAGVIYGNGAGLTNFYVGGQSALNVASGAIAANTATNANLANTIVKRDGSGNFSAGTVSVTALSITGGADVAEPFLLSGADIPQGAVVVIDDAHAGQLKLSTQAYDKRVAGIVSGAGGVNPGVTLSQQRLVAGGQNVALTGRVYVLADAAYGPIEPGDLLTSSATAGHAMKASDATRASGAILGKAMSRLESGRGLVLVLVTLQ